MEKFMEVRKVSSKSQLTLPREFAGKLVSIDRIAKGVLQIKIGQFVPDSESIFHSREYQKRLDRFDEWMDKHDPQDSDLSELLKGNES
jgi:bifunctional DNA-binding transcriptional regulator/antitoxin component of YhaV-PrlF toxin-antitoxin module